ncbi:zinc finger protein 131-like [Metopolophium dirhodum]|uniref:zinc finger protein 131-like n=1 Tax=Metopolophium dirhodum TaxID=44670 RepID=UPI0029900995|nr:zinc finger protein 131-like [Metopolophium dirhodum]
MTGVCFLCVEKLYGERTQVCSSITPHSNILYPQIIAQLLGDDIMVIVTPEDYMCKNCSLLLTHMDKLENDLKNVKNSILLYIQKKYGILLPDQIVKGVMAEEKLEKDDLKVPSGLTVGVSPTVTTATVVTPVQTPLKLLKTQQQQQQQQQRYQPQQQSPTQQDSTNKMKIYKCGICTFQSNEFDHVRFHLRTHMNKKETEKPILNQAAAKALTPVPQQKKRIYKCQVCSKSFNSRIDCLDHIHKDHTQPTPSTSNGVNEKLNNAMNAMKCNAMKSEPSKTQENKVESHMDVDKYQQDNNKGTVDTDMMLNDNVHTKGSGDVEQEEGTENTGEGKGTENSQEDKTVKEVKSKIKPEPAQEKATEEEDTVLLDQEEAGQETPDSVEKEVDEDNANVEKKMGDLNIESMLAAIHNDNPTDSEYTQNKD